MTDLKQTELFPTQKTLTSSQEATLAPLFQFQDLKKVKKIRDISGQKCLDLSKNSGLLLLLEKTLLTTLNSVWTPYYRTWRVKVTPQARLVFQLRASVLSTNASASGLLRTWRTPDAHCGRGPSSKERRKMKLDKKMPISLNDQVAHPNLMWPTPKATDYFPGVGKYVEENRSGYTVTRKKTGTKFGAKLADAVDFKGRLAGHAGGSLNPTWVEWLMGYPKGWTDLKD